MLVTGELGGGEGVSYRHMRESKFDGVMAKPLPYFLIQLYS